MDIADGAVVTTVAELLVDALGSAGVQRIWGVVGDALNPFVDALADDERITWYATRHEEAAAFAAGAETRSPRASRCAPTSSSKFSRSPSVPRSPSADRR